MSFFFFFNDTATTEIYTLSLHDALPIFVGRGRRHIHTFKRCPHRNLPIGDAEERAAPREKIGRATSELQSPCNLVCRLLLEKKKHVCVCYSSPDARDHAN